MNESRFTYTSQFALLLGLMGCCIIFSGLIVGVLGAQWMHVPFAGVGEALNRPENANISRTLNTLASLGAFVLPALVLARVLSRQPFQYLGFNNRINIKQVLLVVLIAGASVVLNGALAELNERIPLPATWLARAKAMEETYKSAMMSMAQMHTFGEYLLGLLVLGACPAIFEEILFRGGFQQVFIGWTKNKWIGLVITGIFFSAIHFSYFGFLPRMVLGIVLGLVFYHSRNLWLSIILHFLNNAFVVTQLYIISRQGKSIEKTMDEGVPLYWGAIAIVLLIIFMRPFREESEKLLAAENKIADSSPENILS